MWWAVTEVLCCPVKPYWSIVLPREAILKYCVALCSNNEDCCPVAILKYCVALSSHTKLKFHICCHVTQPIRSIVWQSYDPTTAMLTNKVDFDRRALWDTLARRGVKGINREIWHRSQTRQGWNVNVEIYSLNTLKFVNCFHFQVCHLKQLMIT